MPTDQFFFFCSRRARHSQGRVQIRLKLLYWWWQNEHGHISSSGIVLHFPPALHHPDQHCNSYSKGKWAVHSRLCTHTLSISDLYEHCALFLFVFLTQEADRPTVFFPSEALAHFGDPESSIALLVRALSNGLYIPPVYRNKTFNAGGNGRKHFRKLWEKTFFFAGAIVDEEICLSHQSDRSAAWPLFPSLLSLNKRRRRCFTLNILRQICRKKIQRFRNCLGRKISKRDDDGDWKIVSIVDQLF